MWKDLKNRINWEKVFMAIFVIYLIKTSPISSDLSDEILDSILHWVGVIYMIKYLFTPDKPKVSSLKN